MYPTYLGGQCDEPENYWWLIIQRRWRVMGWRPSIMAVNNNNNNNNNRARSLLQAYLWCE